MFILIVWKTSDKKLLCIIFSLIYICLDLHNKSDFHKQLCTKVAHFCAKWLHHENLGKIRTYQVPCQPELWKDYPIIEESVKPDRENSRFLYVGFYFTQYSVSRSKTPWTNVYINFKKTKTQLAGDVKSPDGRGNCKCAGNILCLRKRVYTIP